MPLTLPSRLHAALSGVLMQRDSSTVFVRFFGTTCLAAAFAVMPCSAAKEDAADEAPAAAKPAPGAKPNGKAVKYYELLVKRPEPGYLFDRFYNTWLDESTVDALEAF